MRQLVVTGVKLSGVIGLMVFMTSCGAMKQMTETNQSITPPEAKKIDTAFASITDATTAGQTLDTLESYINQKTGQVGFTIDTQNRTVLIDGELKRRGLTETGAVLSGLSSSSQAEVANAVMRQYSQTLTYAQIAAIYNSIKQADTAAITESQVGIIQDRLHQTMPHVSPENTGQVGPIEALVIGYVLASNDDGAAPDGTVSLNATQAEVAQFVSAISEQCGRVNK